ncbi:MAG: DUF4139 domain-containing protein, partial [Ottowia sp.]|nr:DUF4139 domain-containing protein [Ottowia sp.]
ACASPLDERIRALEDRLAALQAEDGGIEAAVGYLNSFQRPAEKEGQGAAAPGMGDPGQIAATAQALSHSMHTVLQRRHELLRQQQAVEEELKPLLAECKRIGGGDAKVSVVSVTLAAERAGQLRLTYQVRGPGWQPGYRATLDSSSKKVLLQRQALVAQNTGEDWNGVRLTLSTGQPGGATEGPTPRPWRVTLRPPMQKNARAAGMAMESAPMAMARSVAREDADAAAPEEEPMPSFDVTSIDSAYATEFAVPQPITVPSSGQRVSLTLGEQQLDAKLRVRTSPAQEEAAYLIAEIAAPEGVWPGGPLDLYRDGAYVGKGRFDVDALARSGLAFGRDENVRVRAEMPKRGAGSAGFIGSRREQSIARTYTIENRHKDAIELQVLDAAPVSEHEDVRVQSSYQPNPTSTEWRQQPGTVLWEHKLAAGGTQKFSASHTITWPKDQNLSDRH